MLIWQLVMNILDVALLSTSCIMAAHSSLRQGAPGHNDWILQFMKQFHQVGSSPISYELCSCFAHLWICLCTSFLGVFWGLDSPRITDLILLAVHPLDQEARKSRKLPTKKAPSIASYQIVNLSNCRVTMLCLEGLGTIVFPAIAMASVFACSRELS